MKIEFLTYIVIFIFQFRSFWETRKKITVFSDVFSCGEKHFSLGDENIQEKSKISSEIFWIGAMCNYIFDQETTYKIYRCEINPENKDEAYFYFSDEPHIKEAYFENIKERIYDVAELSGNLYKEASIITIEPGILNRDGNDWILTKKAKIKFSDSQDVSAKNAVVYIEKNEEYEKIKKMIKNYIGHSTIAVPLLSDVKKITEEHLNKLEDEINRSLTTPLYFGLMGTILGIIFGLWEYSSGAGADGITALIWSVKYAMILSFAGLGLTVLNSTKKFNDAKSKLEETKEQFYVFLRKSGKFPVMKDDFASALKQMQKNLVEFNDRLGANLDKMGSEYKDSLEVLTNIDMKALRNVLLGINTTVGEFRKFSDKFKSLDEYLQRIKDLLDKISSFEHFKDAAIDLSAIAARMEKSVDGNNNILRFLNDSIENLEKIRDVAIATGNEASETLFNLETDLKDYSKTTKEKIKDILTESKNDLDLKSYEIKEISQKTEENVKTILNEAQNSFAMRSDEFIEKMADTNTRVAATFSELAQNIKGMSPDQWKNTAVIGQMDGLAAAMVKSFETIHESIGQWKNKIEDEIKNSENTEIDKSIETLNQNMAMQLKLLEHIQEHCRPRSIFMILKDLIGISR